MSTKSKSALAERIRGVLAHDESSNLSHDVVAALAESAILLEVQCEESKVLFDLIPIVVSRLLPRRDDDAGLPDCGRPSPVLEQLVLENLRSKGADTPEKVFELLQSMGADPDLCTRVASYAAQNPKA